MDSIKSTENASARCVLSSARCVLSSARCAHFFGTMRALKWGGDIPMKKNPRSILAIVIIAAAAFLIARIPPSQNTAEANDGAAPPPAASGDSLSLVKLEPIVVNLNDEEETHYLKCALELQVPTSKDVDVLTARASIIRNELILLFSSLTFADTRGEKAKVELLNRIVTRVNRALGEERVKKVYFTDFVVQ
jgi:flagellar protein FliL